MVNLFTTLAGICTRLINGLIALAPWVSFAIWLEIRDVFYLVSTVPTPPSCNCTSKICETNELIFRLLIYFVPVVVLEALCRLAIPVMVGSGQSSCPQHKARRADHRVLGMYDL